MAYPGSEVNFQITLLSDEMPPGEHVSFGDLPANTKLVSVDAIGSYRSESAVKTITAIPGEHVVVLQIKDGPKLVLHPHDAEDLLATPEAGLRGEAGKETLLAHSLPWTQGDSNERGVSGSALGTVLQWIGLVSCEHLSLSAELIAADVTRKVDGKVDEGIYKLSQESLPAKFEQAARVKDVPPRPNGKPILFLIHGTFVNTASTFGKLWTAHKDTVGELFRHYEGHVYALDHATMGSSPIANALTLARSLPGSARIHLLTHSRGGQIADILVRASARRLKRDDLRVFSDPNYSTHQRDLLELSEILMERDISVERVVRVACPARGTLLASKRLDAYLSVIQWLLQQAGIPVAPEFVAFLYEVARCRANPKELPGLESMMPESPVVAWLNSPLENSTSDLRVIAGDTAGDGIVSWLKALLADAFYWTDNDLVVQTRSMYGGAPRAGGEQANARFIRLHGAGVSHFRYFSNEESVRAVRDGLLEAEPTNWRPIGPLSWKGEDASGLRDASARKPRNPELPAVFVLPDFLGSRLEGDSGKRYWLTQDSFINPAFLSLNGVQGQGPELRANGLLGTYYGELIARLEETHDVYEFAYDWRKPMETEAARLASEVLSALSARNNNLRPVRLLAHGAGGLIVRAMRLKRPDAWNRLMARDGARLLMLGTPHGGSWSPMQILSGDDTIGNTLATAGSLFNERNMRQAFASMPGLLQLQAGLQDSNLQLDQRSTWERLAREDDESMRRLTRWHLPVPWVIPAQAVLDQAAGLRRDLDEQLSDLTQDASKMAIVLGHATHTPDGYLISEKGLMYQYVMDAGDGRVTHSSARLRGVKTWRLTAEHGQLCRAKEAFSAYVDILQNGTTALLESLDEGKDDRRSSGPGDRLKPKRTLGRLSRGNSCPTLPASPAAIFDAPQDQLGEVGRQAQTALHVQVMHGNLMFVKQALVIGHYQALSLSGAEAVVDGLVRNRMSQALVAGLYPAVIGSSHVFDNPSPDPAGAEQQLIPRPKAVVVVGLGEEGKLKTAELSYTVRLGVLSYAERLREQHARRASEAPSLEHFAIAATLLGSGGTGISVGNAALAIVQGVIDANTKLKELGWASVGMLTLVELYLDRATDAWRVLAMQAEATPDKLKIDEVLKLGEGRLRRPLDSSYRGATYDFISVQHVKGMDSAYPAITFSLDSKRARTEVRAQQAQGGLVRDLVAKASNSANTDPQIGRTLFHLLVPVEIEPYLAGSGDMVIELDHATAALPWELLDTDAGGKMLASSAAPIPWAIRRKLIRKLQVENYRTQVVDATPDDNVLIIGEPLCDPSKYARLPGAQREALAIEKVALGVNGGVSGSKIVLLAKQDNAQTIINALFARSYRAVHIGGHGMDGRHGGVVLSGAQTYLGADEIKAMRVTPELVFLNCCHLARIDSAEPQREYDRSAFAATIAEELIQIGVRCVIAAGWAVEDLAAEKFATTFYSTLFGGARFIDAVGEARRAAWEVNRTGNTWAAYQCYGDPEWSWRRNTTRPQAAPEEEYAGIASATNLVLVLDGFTTEADYTYNSDQQRNIVRLQYLDKTFKDRWGCLGEVAQAFGKAYSAVQDRGEALRWFEAAINAADGGADMTTMELYAGQLCLPLSPEADLKKAIRILRRMIHIAPSLKRYSIIGIAQRRLSKSYQDSRCQEAMLALAQAQKYYEHAIESAMKEEAKYKYYPLRAKLACILRKALLQRQFRPDTLGEPEVLQLDDLIRKAVTEDPDFWSIVAQSEFKMMTALPLKELHKRQLPIQNALKDLQKRISAPRFWLYVYDDALFLLEPYQQLMRDVPQEQNAAAEILAVLRSFSGQ
jgi:tetratricopeptide (TPR) repeat protein/pimeloyl-ACP methyl ester carboxylesterase